MHTQPPGHPVLNRGLLMRGSPETRTSRWEQDYLRVACPKAGRSSNIIPLAASTDELGIDPRDDLKTFSRKASAGKLQHRRRWLRTTFTLWRRRCGGFASGCCPCSSPTCDRVVGVPTTMPGAIPSHRRMRRPRSPLSGGAGAACVPVGIEEVGSEVVGLLFDDIIVSTVVDERLLL